MPHYETLAVYRTTVAKRGAPRTAMQNTTAIASGNFGNGRVLCFSPHPEKTSGLERFVHRAVLAVVPKNESVFASELILDQSQTAWEASR